MSLRGFEGGRRYWVTKAAYIVHCEDCGWKSAGANAKGNAARHHDATSHTVHVEECRAIVYTTAERYAKDFPVQGATP